MNQYWAKQKGKTYRGSQFQKGKPFQSVLFHRQKIMFSDAELKSFALDDSKEF